MRSTSLVLCLTLLSLYSHSDAAIEYRPKERDYPERDVRSVNCRKFVYHPHCRGVAAKRSDLPTTVVDHRRPESDRKPDEDLSLAEPEYLPLDETLQAALPRRALPPGLWSYLAERPGNIILRRKPDTDNLELAYDYD